MFKLKVSFLGRTSDIHVKSPSERSEWVLDKVAAPHTDPKGGRTSPKGEGSAPLPCGEQESSRGTPRNDLSTISGVGPEGTGLKFGSVISQAQFGPVKSQSFPELKKGQFPVLPGHWKSNTFENLLVSKLNSIRPPTFVSRGSVDTWKG